MKKRSIIYLNIISIFLAVAISHFLTKFAIFKEMDKIEIAQEENEPEVKINEPIIIDRYDETLHKRLVKIEEYIKDNSEITTTIKTAMESEAKKMKVKETSEQSFKIDMETYDKDIQKTYLKNDKKSIDAMLANDYKKCAELTNKGLTMLNRKSGIVYEIGLHRKSYCLSKSGKLAEARTGFEELIALNLKATFSNGVSMESKVKVDLYRVCAMKKDFECIGSLENDLYNMGKEPYSKDNSVESEVNKIKNDNELN
jgi:hypothetical protein